MSSDSSIGEFPTTRQETGRDLSSTTTGKPVFRGDLSEGGRENEVSTPTTPTTRWVQTMQFSSDDIMSISTNQSSSTTDTPKPSTDGSNSTTDTPKSTSRKNCCPYCEKLLSNNFGRHLVARHKDKEEVKEYLALADVTPKRRKRERAVIANRIRNRGNHEYNKRLVERGGQSGEYLPVKRSSHGLLTVDNTTHVECIHCLGLFKKKSFYKHVARCSDKVTVATTTTAGTSSTGKSKWTRSLPDHASLVVRQNEHASEQLRKEVFPKMQKDAETVVVQNDSLICQYGSNFRFTHRTVKHIGYVSTRMRTLARLLMEMKKLKPEIKEFRDCLATKYFKVMMECVRNMSRFDHSDGKTGAPSVPARLCSSLKNCADLVITNAIQDESLNKSEKADITAEMDNFLHLMKKRWANEVGSNSEKSRRQKRVAKAVLLPDPNDIVTMNEFTESLRERYVSDLLLVPIAQNYERLAMLIIVHILILNRRRPNETVEITLEAYRSTLVEDATLAGWFERQNVLSSEQLRAGAKLVVFYIAANKNMKKVPVLLTKPFHRATEVLVASRGAVGVRSKYLFGRPGGVELFDGTVVLKRFAQMAGLRKPDTFTANSLRHHAATSSQLGRHDETYKNRLTKFMGHDPKTHRDYYEMPLPLIDTAVVGARLLEMFSRPTAKSSTVTSTTVLEDESVADTGSRLLACASGSRDCHTAPGSTHTLPPPDYEGLSVGRFSGLFREPDLSPRPTTNSTGRRSIDSTSFSDEGSQLELTASEATSDRTSFASSSMLRSVGTRHHPSPAPVFNSPVHRTPAVMSSDRSYECTSPSPLWSPKNIPVNRNRPYCGITPLRSYPARQRAVTTSVSHSPTGQSGYNYCPSPPTADTAANWSDSSEGPSRDYGESVRKRRSDEATTSTMERSREPAQERHGTAKEKHKKKRWSESEKRAVYERFGKYFLTHLNPPRNEVRIFWESEPVLKNRTLLQVVTYVNNIVTDKQRIDSPVRQKIKRMVSGRKEKLSSDSEP